MLATVTLDSSCPVMVSALLVTGLAKHAMDLLPTSVSLVETISSHLMASVAALMAYSSTLLLLAVTDATHLAELAPVLSPLTV